MIRAVIGALMVVTVALDSGVPETSESLLPERVQSWMLFEDIPGNAGMPYFYGVWRNEHAGGPLTITEKVLAHYEASVPEPADPYRILFTGRNYVLIAYRIELLSGSTWTSFGVLSLMYSHVRPRAGYQVGMRRTSCTDESMKSADAFDWPAERLLKVFLDSRCYRIHPESGNLYMRDWDGSSPYWRDADDWLDSQ